MFSANLNLIAVPVVGMLEFQKKPPQSIPPLHYKFRNAGFEKCLKPEAQKLNRTRPARKSAPKPQNLESP